MNRLFYQGREVFRTEDLTIYKSMGFDANGDTVLALKTYEEYIVELIRKKYSINDEFAILRQRDDKPTEFYEYNTYVEKCKAEAKVKLNL